VLGELAGRGIAIASRITRHWSGPDSPDAPRAPVSPQTGWRSTLSESWHPIGPHANRDE
jgi:hypothetical protein